ncbi:hypothetical protein VTK56DRAFT_9406 [Thermocarpiscus australiensis]
MSKEGRYIPWGWLSSGVWRQSRRQVALCRVQRAKCGSPADVLEPKTCMGHSRAHACASDVVVLQIDHPKSPKVDTAACFAAQSNGTSQGPTAPLQEWFGLGLQPPSLELGAWPGTEAEKPGKPFAVFLISELVREIPGSEFPFAQLQVWSQLSIPPQSFPLENPRSEIDSASFNHCLFSLAACWEIIPGLDTERRWLATADPTTRSRHHEAFISGLLVCNPAL